MINKTKKKPVKSTKGYSYITRKPENRSVKIINKTKKLKLPEHKGHVIVEYFSFKQDNKDMYYYLDKNNKKIKFKSVSGIEDMLFKIFGVVDVTFRKISVEANGTQKTLNPF